MRNSSRIVPAALLLLCTVLCLVWASPHQTPGVPTLESLEQLSEEDAAAALSGYTRRDLLNAWGEPQSTMAAFSILHVDLYDAPTRGGWIGILYDTRGLHEKTPESLSVLPVCRVDLQLSSLNELVEKGVS